MWSADNLLLHFELSTRCNAYCPGCPRYVNSSRALNPNLVQDNVSIGTYRSWLSPETLHNRVRRVMFCGNYGDPVANPDIVEILEYTVQHVQPNTYIVINTNGGLGSVAQWTRIGNALRDMPRANVFFSVDGLEETNHIYRREVLWHRVDENIRAYTATGAVGDWDYLQFTHNAHPESELESQRKSWGLRSIRFKDPMGYYWNNTHWVRGAYDKSGKLEYKLQTRTDAVDTVPDSVNTTKPVHSNPATPPGEISCKSLQDWGSELMIHVDGTVYPCCYIGDLINRHVVDPARTELEALTSLSLNTNTFEDICQHLNREMWRDFTPRICSRECSHVQ